VIPDLTGSIRTARLTLQPLDLRHAAEMVDVLADAALYEFTGGEAPDLDALQARYRAQVDGSPDPDEIWCNWIVRRSEDQEAVGFVQATVSGSAADVAWLIGVDHQGQGFATEAAGAMCAWLVENGVSRLTAHIHPRHVASERVALAIGLTMTGDIDDDGEAIWALAPGSG
jgi:RimJ/RimL family protein N-acetyltransferase